MVLALVNVWTDWGKRFAVIGGALVALIALSADCPLWVACARGGATIVVLALLVAVFARLLAWSQAGDREEALARVNAANERVASKERR